MIELSDNSDSTKLRTFALSENFFFIFLATHKKRKFIAKIIFLKPIDFS
jgi:hypothetical protein